MDLYKRFGQIFWGLLMTILHITINGFEIPPRFIGYILIALGCGGLAGVSRRFSTARVLGWILMVLSLIQLVSGGEFSTVFGLVWLALDCAMIWFLLGGVMELAEARQRPDLSQRAANRRIAYLVIMGLCQVAGLIAQGSRDLAAVMGVILLVSILVLLILILHLIYCVRHELT